MILSSPLLPDSRNIFLFSVVRYFVPASVFCRNEVSETLCNGGLAEKRIMVQSRIRSLQLQFEGHAGKQELLMKEDKGLENDEGALAFFNKVYVRMQGRQALRGDAYRRCLVGG